MTTDSDSNGRENQPRRAGRPSKLTPALKEEDPNRDREGWLHLCGRLPQGGHFDKHVPTVETEGPGAGPGTIFGFFGRAKKGRG